MSTVTLDPRRAAQSEAEDSLELQEPRVLSLESYSFNFRIDAAAHLRARMGPPAFVLRKLRLEGMLEGFWLDLQRVYVRLWVAAGDGRIDETGRELRQSLLDDEGRDRHAAVSHARRLHRERLDPATDRRHAFNRGWRRHLERCGLEWIAQQVEEFNRYFPIEAQLSSDPKTGRFVWMGREWEEAVAPTHDEVLGRFPLR